MRLYKNIFFRVVEGIAPGKEGELDLTAEEEAQYVYWNRLEIVPVQYLVVGPRRVAGCAPGEKFYAGYPIPTELMLTQAGHIERVKSSKSKTADKEPDNG